MDTCNTNGRLASALKNVSDICNTKDKYGVWRGVCSLCEMSDSVYVLLQALLC